MTEPIRYLTLNNKPVELNNFSGRCGVIPYMFTETGRIALTFGIDRKTGDITDWGGSRYQDESIHEAARRELKEESNDILTTLGSIENCPIGYSSSAVTFFVAFDHVTLIDDLPKKFHKTGGSEEMINIRIMSLDDVDKCLQGNNFYSIVADVLRTCMPHLHKIESDRQTLIETQLLKQTL